MRCQVRRLTNLSSPEFRQAGDAAPAPRALASGWSVGWPAPALWTDVGEFTLLVFTQEGVPTWEVRQRAKAKSDIGNDLQAAKAAALFEASASC